MTYNRSWRMPAPSSPSVKNQLILAIGRRAFVHLPEARVTIGDFLPFGVRPGATVGEEIRDGQEVEIIAWRPMAPEGLSYQIQRLSDHREWWTRATSLRTSATSGMAGKQP